MSINADDIAKGGIKPLTKVDMEIEREMVEIRKQSMLSVGIVGAVTLMGLGYMSLEGIA